MDSERECTCGDSIRDPAKDCPIHGEPTGEISPLNGDKGAQTVSSEPHCPTCSDGREPVDECPVCKETRFTPLATADTASGYGSSENDTEVSEWLIQTYRRSPQEALHLALTLIHNLQVENESLRSGLNKIVERSGEKLWKTKRRSDTTGHHCDYRNALHGCKDIAREALTRQAPTGEKNDG